MTLIRFGDQRELAVTVSAPTALFRGAGTNRLRFPLTLDPRDSIPVGTPLHLSAQVWLATQSDWLGFAFPDGAVTTRDGEFPTGLLLQMSDEQLAAVEHRRAGADLRIRVEVDLTLGGAAADVPSSGGGPQAGWPTAVTRLTWTYRAARGNVCWTRQPLAPRSRSSSRCRSGVTDRPHGPASYFAPPFRG